jgi:hypothetical protein
VAVLDENKKNTSNAWYEQIWLVVVLCIVFFPIGVYALWKNSSIGKVGKIGITIVIALFVVIGISGNSTSNSSSSNTASNSQKQWVALVSLQGSGDKKSVAFKYTGGKARLRYDFHGDNFGMLAVYVVKDGHSIMREGGFPEITIDGSESGESSLSHLSRGNYYLDVTAVNGFWAVTVEEFK